MLRQFLIYNMLADASGEYTWDDLTDEEDRREGFNGGAPGLGATAQEAFADALDYLAGVYPERVREAEMEGIRKEFREQSWAGAKLEDLLADDSSWGEERDFMLAEGRTPRCGVVILVEQEQS